MKAPSPVIDPEIVSKVVTTLFRPLIHEIAKEIVSITSCAAVDREIDQRSHDALDREGLTPRAYLEAARAKKFRSEKRGRRIVSRLRDVQAWRRGPVEAEQPSTATDDSSERAGDAGSDPDDDLRIMMGLRPRGALRLAAGGRRAR